MNKFIDLIQIENKYLLIKAIKEEITLEINNTISNPFNLNINSYFYNLKAILYILINVDFETAKKEMDLIVKDERYIIKLNKYKKSFLHDEESFEYLPVKQLFLILPEEVLDMIIMDYLFLELVSSGLIRFRHLDAFREDLA